MKKLNIFLVGLVITIIFLSGCTTDNGNIDKKKNDTKVPYMGIPKIILNKYSELGPVYGKSLGTAIYFCTKEKIYVVSGSGGYTGVVYYYKEDGSLIGSSYASDIERPRWEGIGIEPKVNVFDQKECKILKNSKQNQELEKNIPEDVLSFYIKNQVPWISMNLSVCKNDSYIYVIDYFSELNSKSGSYSGGYITYDVEGKALDNYYWETPKNPEKKSPTQIKENSCKVLKSTEKRNFG